MRYSVSGANDTIISGLPAKTVVDLLGNDITTGRVLWLRGMWAWSLSGGGVLDLWDGTQGQVATASTASLKFRLGYASAAATDIGTTTMVEFPAPGLKFSTGCGVVMDETPGTATSRFAVGSVGGYGYEE